ncbi:MAG: DUF3365 domain-containing protein [Hyphomicrobiales bacterium]|nr:DUF3365 domain-containing protein [Hyphomicrobiales bacterium]
MVRKKVLLVASLALLASPAFADQKMELANEGKQVIGAFAKALKGELIGAMKTGGPSHAITVCNVKAPAIASEVSEDRGWIVARSSHKLRNSKNAPDEFTRATIEEFLARQDKGEKAADLAKAAIVEENNKRVFRLVKAIPTGKVCLNCHGSGEVKPDTADALMKLYPEDQARGFTLGEMRGVFTLQKVLSE